MNNQQKQMRNRDYNKTPSPSGNKGVIIGIFIVVLVLINYKLFSNIITDNPETVYINPLTAEQQSALDEAEKAKRAIQMDIDNNFISLKVNADDTKSGNLILVNNDFAYKFDASPLAVKRETPVTFYSRQSDTYTVSYPSRERLTPTAMQAFNSLSDDFTAQTGIRNLLLVDSERTYDDQMRVYEEKGSEIATIPGHSEHHTCLAFDLDIHPSGEFDGTGEYAWIAQNCHKYGYILRYAEDKTAITEISYEPWHFRYVGKEHAYYMHENNLCLEEYIRILANYPIDSARLCFTTDEGESYVVYSVPVSGDSAEIKVPKNYDYSLTGDNNGHVIVSYKTSLEIENTEADTESENEAKDSESVAQQ